MLHEQLPTHGRFQEFYLRLTGIVRRYIEETTGIKAYEQTTGEFLTMRWPDAFSPERAVRLADFLEAADLVKYAAQSPDVPQIDLAIARAREFVGTVAPRASRSLPELTRHFHSFLVVLPVDSFRLESPLWLLIVPATLFAAWRTFPTSEIGLPHYSPAFPRACEEYFPVTFTQRTQRMHALGSSRPGCCC